VHFSAVIGLACLVQVSCAPARGPGWLLSDAEVSRRAAKAPADGRFERAAFYADEAIERLEGHCFDMEPYVVRSMVFLSQRRYQEGLEWFDAVALDACRDVPSVIAIRAVFLLRLGRTEEARQAANAVLAVAPGTCTALWVLVRMCKATCEDLPPQCRPVRAKE
jgi:predicted RNA polymerase sigma factor